MLGPASAGGVDPEHPWRQRGANASPAPWCVRAMTLADAAAVAGLLPALGYSDTALEVERRWVGLQEWPDQAVFVAEQGARLIGLCHVHGVRLLASDGYAEVGALVVDVANQRTGVGAALLKRALAWAGEAGYGRLRLRSGLHREGAHGFYEAQGFARSRASYAFERLLVQQDVARQSVWRP